MKTKRARWIIIIAMGLVIYFIGIGMFHQKIGVKFKSGSFVEIRAPSAWAAIFGSKCEIDIKSRNGRTGHIELLRDICNMPLLVIPTTNESIFFCVYDYDIDFQLLKIDVSKIGRSAQTGDFLFGTVLNANCAVRRVRRKDVDDWAAAEVAIEEMSPARYRREEAGLDLGFYRIQIGQNRLVASIRNFGDQGGYPDDYLAEGE